MELTPMIGLMCEGCRGFIYDIMSRMAWDAARRFRREESLRDEK